MLLTSDHPLLSAAAALLPPTELGAEERLARLALGLKRYAPPEGDAEALDDLKDALALQVNFRLEHGTDPAVYTSVSRGARSYSYRAGVYTDPTALALALALLAAGATPDEDEYGALPILR